jgi:hypothetical protein
MNSDSSRRRKLQSKDQADKEHAEYKRRAEK